MIEVSDFERDVLEASRERPVLVDFWAPWCGPCRQLGPILEKLDAEDERFTLAKLNTDEDQATAVRYDIRSIPAVKLFVDGEVADEFIGALPEAQVRRWLSAALPSEAKRLVEEAKGLLEAGDTVQARSLLEDALSVDAANAEALMGLARLVVFEDAGRARQLAQQASRADASMYDEAQSIETLADLLESGGGSGLPEDAAKEPLVQGLERLRQADFDGALTGFVDSVRRNRHYQDDAARRAALAVFKVLGPRHPLSQKHQRALEMALF